MTTVLLVEEAPDLGLYEAQLLEAEGYHVLRCSGRPTAHSVCPMMHDRPCPLADTADVIVFACSLYTPLHGSSYRGEHLLRAYREHDLYGRKPMLIVSAGRPGPLPGSGALAIVPKFDDPAAIVAAVEHLSRTLGGRTDEGTGPDDRGRGVRRAGHAVQGDR